MLAEELDVEVVPEGPPEPNSASSGAGGGVVSMVQPIQPVIPRIPTTAILTTISITTAPSDVKSEKR